MADFDLSSATPVSFDPNSAVPVKPKYGTTLIKNDATSGMSTMDKFWAGMGKAPVDLGRGIKQIYGRVADVVDPRSQTMSGMITGNSPVSRVDQYRQEIAEDRKYDAPLMQTGAGKVGNLAGNVATMLPAAFVPGANTLAGAGTIGALSGLLQPSTSTGEAVGNTALGGALGPASLLAGRGVAALGKGAWSALEPLFQKGQQNILARTTQAFAGGPQDAAAAASRLQNPGSILPGVQPTSAELGNNAGLAQLERQLGNNPEFLTQLTNRTQANRSVMNSAIGGIAGNDAQMSAAEAARKAATASMYDAANKVSVPTTPELEAILQRPSMAQAWNRAQQLAAERGDTLVRPGAAPAIPTTSQRGVVSGKSLDPLTLTETSSFDPLGSLGNNLATPRVLASGGTSGRPSSMSFDPLTLMPAAKVPAQYSGKVIQYLKMAMNDIANSGPQNGMGSHEVGAVKGTLGALNDWTSANVPALRAADAKFAELSKPINQMNVGQQLKDKLMPALADFNPDLARTNANAYAGAVRNGDQLAANATGYKGSTLSNVLTPDQHQTVRQVGEQLARRAQATDLGRAAGSNTSQNTVSQNVIRQFLGPLGLPQSMADRAASSTLMQSIMRPMQFVGSLGENKVQQGLLEAVLNPDKMAGLLSKPQSAALSKLLWRQQGLLNAPAQALINSPQQ